MTPLVGRLPRLPGGVYDYADLRSPDSSIKVMSLFTGTEFHRAGLRIFPDSAYRLCSPEVTQEAGLASRDQFSDGLSM